MSDEDTSGSVSRRSKVERVIDAYGLEGLGERLERAWRGEGQPRQSLRELADEFNRAVLEAAMREGGLSPLDGEVDNMYRLLTDEGVSGGQRAEAEAKLERSAVDPEELAGDFVSHQAIHTYLTKHRGVEPPGEDDDRDRTASARSTIERTKGRLRSITEGNLSDLREAGELSVGTFDVIVGVRVYCEDCGRRFEATELLDRGGCDCE